MLDYARQARTALSVYLARRRAALASLEEGRYDDAQVMLRKGTEAFHNFRAADHAALKAGCDVGGEKEIQALFLEIGEVEARLEGAMKNAREKVSEELARVSRDKMICRGYRSGSTEQGCFERSV
jgi:hypothetical protein